MRRRLSGRKRPILALGTIAASSFILSGCGDDPPSDRVFSSVDQCVSSGLDQQLCQTAYQDAMRAHLANAPRFDGAAACEAEYGKGQCTEEKPVAGSTSTGSFFVPFLSGYLLSSTISNLDDYYRYRRQAQQQTTASGYGGSYGYGPVYRNRSGQTVTTTTGGGRDAVLSPSVNTKPVNVNTRTVSRQGFGGRSSFSFGG